MKHLAILLFSIIFQSIFLFAQGDISWQKTLGGSDHEYTMKTIPTADGGMAFVGFSQSNNGDVSGNHGGVDLWVGKMNSAGIVLWSFLYGGTGDEEGSDIVQTADGGYMVAGWTDSNDGDVTGHHGNYDADFWVLKLTSSGTLTWAKCFGGTYAEKAAAMVQSQDGNFYITGTTYSTDGDVSGLHGTNPDFWVIKINSSGSLLEQKCIGGTGYDEGINITLTSDNGCIVCGRTDSGDGDAVGYHGGSDMLVAKLNSSLMIEWSKCFGGSQTEECNAIVQLSDGSYAGLGYTSTHNNGEVTGHHGAQGSDDFWLVRISSAGVFSSAKCYGGSGDDQADALIKTYDGGFLMCGLTNSTDGDVSGFHQALFDPDVWVIKVTAAGITQWQRCCGGSGQDEGFNVYETGNGLYTVTAFTYSNDFDVSGNHGSADGWIFRVAGNTAVNELTNENQIIVYPNPATDKIFVKTELRSDVKIINVIGQIIYEITDFQNDWIYLPAFSEGIYFVQISNSKTQVVNRLVITK